MKPYKLTIHLFKNQKHRATKQRSTGIFTTIIVYCKVVINHIVLRLYKHSCNLFPPVTDDEHGGVWNMFYRIKNVVVFLKFWFSDNARKMIPLNISCLYSSIFRFLFRVWLVLLQQVLTCHIFRVRDLTVLSKLNTQIRSEKLTETAGLFVYNACGRKRSVLVYTHFL